MGNNNDDDWAIQLSIKHGPGQQYMTNVRGYTARDVLEHVENLAELSSAIDAAVTAFLSHETVRDAFPQAERASRYGSDDRGRSNSGGGNAPVCKGHERPREYKSGSKNGKKWAGWFCTASKNDNPCAVQWDD